MGEVSVIIPVYNTEKHLRECLNSVIGQDLVDIEIICINDGSKDNSLEILKEYAMKDNRVIIVDKKNEGVGKARNDGINKATSKYICFMDSDDYYPNKNVLSFLLNAVDKYDVKIAGGYALTDLNGQQKMTPDFKETLNFSLKKGVNRYADYGYDYEYWKYIYDRDMLVNNDIYFPIYSRFQDPPFFVKAMFTAKEFVYIDYPTYYYRVSKKPFNFTVKKAKDMINGMMDVLTYSYINDISKLYYLTSLRLNKDCTFVLEKLVDKGIDISELLIEVIKANASIDYDYLLNRGFKCERPKAFDFFRDMLNMSIKYNKLRNIKLLLFIRKVMGK